MQVGIFDQGRLGIRDPRGVRDVTDWALARSSLRTHDPMLALIDAVGSGSTPEGALIQRSDVRWRAPLAAPSKIIAAAANYRKHTEEMNPGVAAPGGVREKGFFLKAPSSIIGPGDAIRLPLPDRRTDYEAELAVVMGRRAKDIASADALHHVFGYTCLLDITVRGKEDRGLRKSFDTFTPIGPYITTRDEIPDPNALAISCRINGEVRQDDSTASMTLHVPDLIAWISRVMTLLPGDVIATGTPAGVGPLASGDRVVASVERLGSLTVVVA